MLAKGPAERFSSARDVAEALESWLAGRVSETPAALTATSSPRQRGVWMLGVSGLAVAAILAVVCLHGLGPREAAPEEPVIPAPPGPPAARMDLHGELTLTIWSDKGKGSRVGQQVGTPNSLPVRSGESLRLEVQLNQPAHVYLIWITSQGKVYPLHPWDPVWGFQAPPLLPASGPAPVVVANLASLSLSLPQHHDEPQKRLGSPATLDNGWEVEGPAGLETFLLLARHSPLPVTVDLRGLVGQPAAIPVGKPDQFDWLALEDGKLCRLDPSRPRVRGPQVKRIDDPLVWLLVKLQPHFELLQGVRFAKVEQ